MHRAYFSVSAKNIKIGSTFLSHYLLPLCYNLVRSPNAKEACYVHMYSYPNLIPLPATAVQRIREKVEPLAFERLYGAWFERIVPRDAHAVVQRSAERYIRALERIPD